MAPVTPLPRIVYFHGQPGGPREWNFFAPDALNAFIPNRSSKRTLADLSQDIEDNCDQGSLVIIAFSLGVPVALSVAASLRDRIASIHLISPAAPLQLGNFFRGMEGGALFKIAQSKPYAFRLTTKLQGLLARFTPTFLMDLMFANAAGEDLALSKDPAFRQMISASFSEGLGRDQSGFTGEVIDYVADWTSALSLIHVPVTIWQGERDNWTPPEMATALAERLGAEVVLNLLPDCSHYSALGHFLASHQAKCLVQDTLAKRGGSAVCDK